MDVLAQVLAAIELLAKFEPVLVATAQNLKPFAVALFERFSGHAITAEQRADLEKAVDLLHAKFQEPLPPPEPGDPDYVAPT